ncbi:glycosyltransferase family 2 protein [Flavobacterium sp. KS-LB2]|uniref:glycosyltransferase family 2 protein n=1 Tax=Flavobacterium sp. KS-LB2 TaxID=3120525 RepID=UPI0030CF4390
MDDALQSVLHQTYTNWECIIVNDGSPDHTAELSKKWVEKDRRFIYLEKENGGLSSARNAGLAVSKGDFIQFLDSDDLLNKYKLEKQLACFSNNIDVVICDYFPFDEETGAFLSRRYMNPFPDLVTYKKDIINKWELELSIPCHCVLFKSKLLNQKTVKFDESLPNHEDWVFWVQLFYSSSGIFNLTQTLVSYRIHNEAMCADNKKMTKGFILACKMNKNFFESIGDKKALELSLKKLKLLENKKDLNLTKVFKLFVPPIFLILRKKLFKLCFK